MTVRFFTVSHKGSISMLHSGCVKMHQKFRDFVGLPMGLLREGSPKNRMNTGLFGSRSGECGLKAARRAPQFSKR